MIRAEQAVVFDGTGKPETRMKVYGRTLASLAKERRDIVCLCADLTKQTEVDAFRADVPERFFSMGMAEQNMVGAAAGLAQGGYVPFANSFAVFLTRRPYDQVAMSVAYPRLNVKLVGMMPGLSSPGGASHQAIDDLAMMRATPNMAVIDAGEATEVAQAIRLIADHDGPVYLRLRRGELPLLFDPERFELKLGESYLLREGESDGAGIVTSGLMTEKALRAHALLQEQGWRVSVLHAPSIKPLDAEGVRRFAGRHRLLVTLDNHNVIGGLGSAVVEALAEEGIGVPVVRLGVQDVYGQAATSAFLYRKHGLEPDQIAETIVHRLTGGRERLAATAAAAATAESSVAPGSSDNGESKGWGGSF